MRVILIDTFLLGDKVYTAALASALVQAGHEVEIIVPAGMAALSRLLCPEASCLELAEVPWIRGGWIKRPAQWLKFWKAFAPLRHHARGTVGLNLRGGLLQRLLLMYLDADVIIQGPCVPRDVRSRIMGGYDRNILESMDAVYACFQAYAGDGSADRITWPYLGPGMRRITRKVILAPEASTSLKEWPLVRWVELAALLRARGFEPTYVVHSLDAGNLEPDASLFKGDFGAVREFIKDAAFVVGVDSFLGHYAAAMGIPVVTLYATGASRIWAHPRTPGSLSIDPVAERGHPFDRKSYRMRGLDDMSAKEVFRRISPLLSSISK